MATKGARRFHEPGVGSRTGMRITDGAEGIEDFMNAGMAAMDRHPDDYSDEEEEEEVYGDEDEDSPDEYGGTARSRGRRSAMSSSSAKRRGASSSMMDIEQSSAPSPRSTIRKSMGSRTSLLDREGFQDVEFDDNVGDGPSFDLSNLAGDDDADLYGDEDLDEEEEEVDDHAAAAARSKPRAKGPFSSSSSPRKGPSTGLEARKAARAAASKPVRQPAYRGVSEEEPEDDYYDDEDDAQAEMQLNGDYMEEIVEEDVGPEALDGTTAGEWDRREARAAQAASATAQPKKRGRPAGKGKAANKEPAAKKAATGSKKPRGRPRKAAATRGYEDDEDEDDEEEEDAYGSVPPIRVDKRTIKKFSSNSTRKPMSVQQQVVERVPSAYQRPESLGSEEPEARGVALRKGTRYRYKPLEYWRGEKVRYGRPSLPSGASQGMDDENAYGSGRGRKNRLQPVPVLKEVIRVIRPEDEGTFSGMRRPGVKTGAPRYTKRKRVGSVRAESESEPRPLLEEETGRVVHPEDGWDDETEAHGLVWDPDKEEEIERRIACTARQAQPKTTFNNAFAFEKIFGADACMAAGLLEIPVEGQKPSKPSKDNNYVFVVLEGAVRVRIHRTNILVAPGGMFLVPKGNNYSIENVSQRTSRIFFTQARTERADDASKDVGNASTVLNPVRGDSSWMGGKASTSTTSRGVGADGTTAKGGKGKKLR